MTPRNKKLKIENNLKTARLKVGLTQQELAKRLGYKKYQFVSALENQKEPSLGLRLAYRIAKVLDTSVEDIWTLKN